MIDNLPQASVPVAVTLSLLALAPLLLVVSALARDAYETREELELARLTAALPDERPMPVPGFTFAEVLDWLDHHPEAWTLRRAFAHASEAHTAQHAVVAGVLV